MFKDTEEELRRLEAELLEQEEEEEDWEEADEEELWQEPVEINALDEDLLNNRELDILLDTMKRVADKHISPDEKMLEMIYTRLDVVKEVVYRNGTLRADFFRDIWKVEKARKRFDEKEVQLFKDVLREGMETGVFQIDDLDMTAELVHYCVKGIEVPYIRGQIGANLDDATRDKYVARIVFGALHRKDPKAL